MPVQTAVNATAVNVPTTTETVVAVLPFDGVSGAGALGILIQGFINLTPGTTTSAAVVRVRQGALVSGTLVGTADTVTVTAANPVSIPFAQLFTGGQIAGNQFCVTVQQTAATANGTVNDVTAFLDYVTPLGGS